MDNLSKQELIEILKSNNLGLSQNIVKYVDNNSQRLYKSLALDKLLVFFFSVLVLGVFYFIQIKQIEINSNKNKIRETSVQYTQDYAQTNITDGFTFMYLRRKGKKVCYYYKRYSGTLEQYYTECK